MDEQKKKNEIDEAASVLIENSESVSEDTEVKAASEQVAATKTAEDDGKFFKKYKIKDIVFLAIMTACTLITGAVMPLLVNVPLFGIVQLGLGLQFSIFPVIGMMKVRKPGALFFQSIFIAVFLVFMFPPMSMIVLCGLVAEGIAMLLGNPKKQLALIRHCQSEDFSTETEALKIDQLFESSPVSPIIF